MAFILNVVIIIPLPHKVCVNSKSHSADMNGKNGMLVSINNLV